MVKSGEHNLLERDEDYERVFPHDWIKFKLDGHIRMIIDIIEIYRELLSRLKLL